MNANLSIRLAIGIFLVGAVLAFLFAPEPPHKRPAVFVPVATATEPPRASQWQGQTSSIAVTPGPTSIWATGCPQEDEVRVIFLDHTRCYAADDLGLENE